MEVYPRSRTWPYVSIVLLLFVFAIAYPQWRAERSAALATWTNHLPRYSTRLVTRKQPTREERIAVDLRPDWIRRGYVPLHPPVGERVTLDPEAPLVVVEPQPHGAYLIERDSGQPGLLEAHGAVPVLDSSPATDSTVLPLSAPGAELASGVDISLELPQTDIANVAPALPKASFSRMPSLLQIDVDLLPPTWPSPVALRAELENLHVDDGPLADWKGKVNETLSSLAAASLDAPDALKQIHVLARLANQAESLEATAVSNLQRVQLRTIGYAIERRCAIWDQVYQLAKEQTAAPAEVNVVDLLPVLQDVEQRIAKHPQADAWRNYLMLSRLTAVATESWVTDASVRRDAARTVLGRLADRELTPEQREVVNDRAMQELERHLTQWAEQPIDLPYLLNSIEQFEQLHSDILAGELVDQLTALKYSRQPSAAVLARAINTHYRNANVRFTISGQLLNDLMPTLEPIQQDVRDTILGAKVVGTNETLTDLHVQLLDDADRLHLRVHADGQTNSHTVSRKGPVRLWSRDQSNFQADKDLIVSSEGIYVTHAKAESQGESKLVEIKTDFDQIPLLGWVIRQVARDEHRSQRSRVRAEIQQRVRRQATQQLDSSIHERLEGAETKMDHALFRPLRKLELDPTAIEMKTSQDRLSMRFRLASDAQLAAYTPRPRALADNVLSVQLHESAANNLIEQLDLEDERVELEQLVRELTTKLKIDRSDLHDDIPTGIAVRLANDRPIQVAFSEDRVVLIVRIQELTTPRRTWRNFVVRGRYRADVGQMHVNLEREGGIELISEQIGFRDQVALRGIFTKVLARNHRLNIMHDRVQGNPQLRNLGVTQFEVRDGWIGISVGRVPSKDPRLADSNVLQQAFKPAARASE